MLFALAGSHSKSQKSFKFSVSSFTLSSPHHLQVYRAGKAEIDCGRQWSRTMTSGNNAEEQCCRQLLQMAAFAELTLLLPERSFGVGRSA